jgi:D-alanyl-D-alanine carboxypeptidase
VPRTFDRRLRRALQRIVERTVRRSRLPALSIAVRLPGGETWTAVDGFAQYSPERRATEDTVFAIASVTKTFVAALILQLVDEGRLDLDDRLSGYLPDIPWAGQVTIRQLLSHRSGIYNYFESPRYNRQVFADPDRLWTYEDILGLVKEPYCRPGRCYHYSNTNYVLLGRVAEVITGTPLHALLRARFFDPLGLDHTFYQPDEPTPADAAHGHWAFSGGFTDHTGDQTVIPTLAAASVAGPAGAIASTAADLARWAAALYGGEVLSPDSRREMLRVLPPDGYGLGVRREVVLGHVAYGHRGGIRGFVSSMFYFPKEDVAIAVLSNRGLSRTDPPFKLAVRAVLGRDRQRRAPRLPAPVTSPPAPVTSPPAPVTATP